MEMSCWSTNWVWRGKVEMFNTHRTGLPKLGAVSWKDQTSFCEKRYRCGGRLKDSNDISSSLDNSGKTMACVWKQNRIASSDLNKETTLCIDYEQDKIFVKPCEKPWSRLKNMILGIRFVLDQFHTFFNWCIFPLQLVCPYMVMRWQSGLECSK